MRSNLNRLSGRGIDRNDPANKFLSFQRSIKPLPKHEQEQVSDIESTSSISCRPEKRLSKDKPWSLYSQIRRKKEDNGLVMVDLGHYIVAGQSTNGHVQLNSNVWGKCICLNFKPQHGQQQFFASSQAIWASKQLRLPLLLNKGNDQL